MSRVIVQSLTNVQKLSVGAFVWLDKITYKSADSCTLSSYTGTLTELYDKLPFSSS